MPNYAFECDSCHFTYDRFFSLKDWGKFPIKNIKCEKCGKKKVYKVISPVGFKINGWSAGKELARYKHLALAEECMDDARKNGVSRTEQQEGLGLMAEIEKKKGQEPGTISGKKQVQYETVGGKRVLKGGRKEVLKSKAKLQGSLRKK